MLDRKQSSGPRPLRSTRLPSRIEWNICDTASHAIVSSRIPHESHGSQTRSSTTANACGIGTAVRMPPAAMPSSVPSCVQHRWGIFFFRRVVRSVSPRVSSRKVARVAASPAHRGLSLLPHADRNLPHETEKEDLDRVPFRTDGDRENLHHPSRAHFQDVRHFFFCV